MTYAPDDLLAVRRYVLTQTALPGDAVGIVGDPAHASTGGYHEGNDDLARAGRLTSDYSKRQSSRDRPGSNAASALDNGDFDHGGKTLRQLSQFLVARCVAGDPRCRDIREIIYTPDGQSVRRWDALGMSTTGDSSHLYHTHTSFFRDSEGRRDRLDNYLGLLVEFFEGAKMAFTPDQEALLLDAANITKYNVRPWLGDLSAAEAARAAADKARDDANTAAITALADAIKAGGGNIDTAAVLARINEVAAAAAAVAAAQAKEIADLRHDLAEAKRAAGEAEASAIEG